MEPSFAKMLAVENNNLVQVRVVFENRCKFGRMSQLILAFGELFRRAERAGKARTMSPSELGFIMRIFLRESDINSYWVSRIAYFKNYFPVRERRLITGDCK